MDRYTFKMPSFIFTLSMLLTTSTLAQESLSSNTLPSVSQSLIQVFGSLTLIVLLILASAKLAKRLKIVGGDAQGQLRALSALPLGRKDKLVLVESCGKKILVGVSVNGVSLIHAFECDDQVTDIHTQSEVAKACEDLAELTLEKENKCAPSLSKKTSEIESYEFSAFLKTMLSGRKDEK